MQVYVHANFDFLDESLIHRILREFNERIVQRREAVGNIPTGNNIFQVVDLLFSFGYRLKQKEVGELISKIPGKIFFFYFENHV